MRVKKGVDASKVFFYGCIAFILIGVFAMKEGQERASYVKYDQLVDVEILESSHRKLTALAEYNGKEYEISFPRRYNVPDPGEMHTVYYNSKTDDLSVFEADYNYVWGRIIVITGLLMLFFLGPIAVLEYYRTRGREYIKIGWISIKVPKIKENKKDGDSYIAQTPYKIKEIEVPNQKVRSWRKKRKMKRGG